MDIFGFLQNDYGVSAASHRRHAQSENRFVCVDIGLDGLHTADRQLRRGLLEPTA